MTKGIVEVGATYKNRQLFLLLFLLKTKPGSLVFMQVYLIYWGYALEVVEGIASS